MPPGSLLLIIGGSPRQQLSCRGPGGGHIGITGRDSVLFHIFPALGHALRLARPDLLVHMVVESAGRMQDLHREAIMDALGIAGSRDQAPVIDAQSWATFPRARTFASTLPPVPAPRVSPRPSPWDRGWAPRPHHELPAMLRAGNRPREPLRASTYQYAPRALVYQQGSIWDLIPDERLGTEIARRMPEHLRPGWRLIERGQVADANEHLAVPAAAWIAVNGGGLGVRTPNTRERSRAMGMSAYLDELELPERTLFDGQGNSLDRDALASRIAGPVLRWLAGGPHPGTPHPHSCPG